MGLGGILQELKTEGVLKLYCDYRSGRYADLSGTGNTFSLVASIPYTKQGMSCNAGNYLTINNTATLQAVTTGTIIARQDTYPDVLSYFFYKTGQYIFNHNAGTNQTFLSSNATTATFNFVGGGLATHAVDFDNAGGIPNYFINGIRQGAMSVGLTILGNANNALTNFGSGSRSARSRYLLLFSRKLTLTEHARVYGQLENMRWNTKGLTPGPMMP